MEMVSIGEGLACAGFLPDQISEIEAMTSSNEGLTLFSGTTGSGKTGSSVSLFKSIGQIIEKGAAEKSVANVLDSQSVSFRVQRNGSDLVLEPEIRLSETTRNIFQDIQLGNQVIATIHASSAFSVFVRLLVIAGEKGEFLGGKNTMNGIVHQALVKETCKCCSSIAEKENAADEYADIFDRLAGHGVTSGRIRNANGCAYCNNGVARKVVVAEVVPMTNEIYKALKEDGPEAAREIFIKNGGKTIQSRTIDKIRSGDVDLLDAEHAVGRLA